MSENNTSGTVRTRKVRYKGRRSQILIYLGKQLRFFVNENDWKVIPMAAIISALVSMVIRNRLFVNMEGCLIGGFALTCVAIWNGCFNSIQSVCRERAIIKREHRSGMHVTSYIAAHMIYQLMLCLLQTGLSLYVMKLLGVPFPAQGFITPWMIVDIGITMLLISYASDMMSLFLSSISHTTTGAMTLMPFVLIFQLVFSGGIIPLPEWSKALSNYTISNYGIKALTAQAGYNELPMVTAWKTLSGMRDTEIGGSVTMGELLDLLDSPAIQKQQDKEVLKSYTVGEVADILNDAESTLHLRDKEVITPFTLREFCNAIMQHSTFKQLREIELVPATEQGAAKTVGSVIQELLADESLQQELDQEIGRTVTLGQVLDALHVSEIAKAASEETLNQPVTVGDITGFLKNNDAIQAQRDRTLTFKTTINDLFELFGEKKIETLVKTKTAKAAWNADYERSIENITDNWLMLSLFVIIFAILSIAVLEFIDKDKR